VPVLRQHFLKALAGSAGAQIVATELLDEFLASNDALTTFDRALGWEALAAFAHHLKSTAPPRNP